MSDDEFERAVKLAAAGYGLVTRLRAWKLARDARNAKAAWDRSLAKLNAANARLIAFGEKLWVAKAQPEGGRE